MLDSVSKTALALLLLAAPASVSAQTTEPATQPVAETQAKDDAESPAKPVQGQITLQSKNTVLASALIGAAMSTM